VEDDMLWDEFINLLSGLNGDTPLGYLVRIRSEKDPKKVKNFTQMEKKIRNDWKVRHQQKVTMTMADTERFLAGLAQAWK